MPTALITGISGQTGSYLAEQLEATNWKVHGIEQNNSLEHPGSQHKHIGSITDSEFVNRVIDAVKPNVVFNLAALSSVADCWENPGLAFDINTVGTANLLSAVSKHSEAASKEIRFVQASSAEIFGNSENSPQDENTPIKPINPYGASKAAAHFLTQNFRSIGIFASNAILYNHESPRRPEKFVTRKITKAVANIVRGHQEVLFLGNLDTRRDWGWAPDYANALYLIAESDTPDDFVVSSGISHTIEDFVALAFRYAGISNWEDYVRFDEKFVRPTNSPLHLGNSAKISKKLKWSTSKTFEEIVSAMVDFDLNQID